MPPRPGPPILTVGPPPGPGPETGHLDRLARLLEQLPLISDQMLTDRQAAELLSVKPDYFRKCAAELIAAGARVLQLRGEGTGGRCVRRWSRTGLLELMRSHRPTAGG